MSTSPTRLGQFRLLPDDRYLGWTPYVWLVYMPMVFLQPALGGGSRVQWIFSLVAAAAFLPLYFRGYWARGREAYLIITGVVAIGVLLVPVNPSGLVFFVYAAAFAGTRRPARRAVQLLVALTVVVVAESLVLRLPFFLWAWAPVVVWMVGGVNAHFASVKAANKELKLARDEIEHLATVAERERIARDLHDLLGHTLSLITLKSSLASRVADRDPARAIAEIRDVERISREALGEVRAAVAGYREAGLIRAVASAEQMLVAAGIEPVLTIDTVLLSANEEGVLALAVREGATNVVKHSRASKCFISLSSDLATRRLSIRDDGTWKPSSDGSGLSGMRERVQAIGGEFAVSHTNGTEILIELRAHNAEAASPVHIVA